MEVAVSRLRREEELESLHHQLEEWQHNLALRVAGEAKALDAELHRLTDDEIEELWEILSTAQQHVFAGTDMLRDLRRRVQTPLFPLDDQRIPPPES
jgi:hypothetical protein